MEAKELTGITPRDTNKNPTPVTLWRRKKSEQGYIKLSAELKKQCRQFQATTTLTRNEAAATVGVSNHMWYRIIDGQVVSVSPKEYKALSNYFENPET